MVMLLEKVVDESVLMFCIGKVHEDGVEARIEGFPCPACRIKFDVAAVPTGVELKAVGKAFVLPTGKASCKYRPLRGPLYVPR